MDRDPEDSCKLVKGCQLHTHMKVCARCLTISMECDHVSCLEMSVIQVQIGLVMDKKKHCTTFGNHSLQPALPHVPSHTGVLGSPIDYCNGFLMQDQGFVRNFYSVEIFSI